MRAAIFQGIGRPLAIETIADPAPGPGDVVVKVALCGICGSDLHRTAGHGGVIPPGARMGHEMAGTVVEIGRDVTSIGIGDNVSVMPMAGCGACAPCRARDYFWCENGYRSQTGGFAEYLLSDARSIRPLSNSLTLADGALVEPLAASLNGVELAGPMRDARVLVLGAGAMGLASIYWTRLLGAGRIVASARSTTQADRARVMGADSFAPNGPALEDAVAGELGGPPDIVIECAGARGVVEDAMRLVKRRGTVIGMGMCGQEDVYNPALAVNKQIRLQFAAAYGMSHFDKAVDALGRGHLEPRGLITRRISLEDLPVEFEKLRAPNADCKVLVDPTG